MAFARERFKEIRPYLYHLTARANVERIARTGRLESAAALMRMMGCGEEAVRSRRREAMVVGADGGSVHIRDQAPLHMGNMGLEKGWSFEDFVCRLNELVFFWPGDKREPIPYGARHFERYREERPVILRVATADVPRTTTTRRLLPLQLRLAALQQRQQEPPRRRDCFLPPRKRLSPPDRSSKSRSKARSRCRHPQWSATARKAHGGAFSAVS